MKPFFSAKLLLILNIFLPLVASAHLLEITASSPFPSTVAATTATLATFTVTNVSNTKLIAEDISHFPDDSGLSVISTTCGELLEPQDNCTLQLSLDAKWTGDTITTALKIWAKPRFDIAYYPIHVHVTRSVPEITLKAVTPSPHKPQLEKFREPMVAKHAGKWLILSGSYGNFHDFDNDFNPDIYVYDPHTGKIKSVVIADTNLPDDVKKQLSSSVPVFTQDKDTLYIVGGYYNDKQAQTYKTLNTVTLVDVPGMMEAVLAGNTNLKRFVAYCSENTTTPCPDNFQVTGGQLEKLGHHLYLTYGHNCEGFYCAISQVYSNAIYKFIAKPNYHHNTVYIKNIDSVVHDNLDGSGWRRRDYSLAPFKWHGADALLAMAGPFTPGPNADVWTNGIIFNQHIEYDSNFMSQQANQYANANLAMYSAKTDTSYVATFAGLSNLYWSQDGLVYDNTTPYGNILDLISADHHGVREYVHFDPMCSDKPLIKCLYMGIGAEFIPANDYYDHRGVLELDELPSHHKTLVGYIYGGLVSYSQEPFDDTDETFVTNQVYEVYVKPSAQGKVDWQNVTNVYTQD